MQIKIFTLPYNVVKEGFDDSEIQKFTQTKKYFMFQNIFSPPKIALTYV
jgi:hypothetical protein